MVPMAEVVTFPDDQPLAELEQLVLSTGHTRIPMVEPDGTVSTYVHSKDLLHIAEGDWAQPPSAELCRPLLSVAAERKLEDVLFRMKQATTHVAAVREGDSMLGIVTMEDVLESLVGDILDESDA